MMWTNEIVLTNSFSGYNIFKNKDLLNPLVGVGGGRVSDSQGQKMKS